MVGGGAVAELSSVLPRVLIVSSRTVRKNKFVNFVGEFVCVCVCVCVCLSLSLSLSLSADFSSEPWAIDVAQSRLIPITRLLHEK
jgi:hypothetical protein